MRNKFKMGDLNLVNNKKKIPGLLPIYKIGDMVVHSDDGGIGIIVRLGCDENYAPEHPLACLYSIQFADGSYDAIPEKWLSLVCRG